LKDIKTITKHLVNLSDMLLDYCISKVLGSGIGTVLVYRCYYIRQHSM